MSAKKIPLRKCVGCREGKAKKELIRIVRTAEGEILLDKSGKAQGRGAYICPDAECLKKAAKSKALDRAFEMKVPDEIYLKLEEQIKEE